MPLLWRRAGQCLDPYTIVLFSRTGPDHSANKASAAALCRLSLQHTDGYAQDAVAIDKFIQHLFAQSSTACGQIASPVLCRLPSDDADRRLRIWRRSLRLQLLGRQHVGYLNQHLQRTPPRGSQLEASKYIGVEDDCHSSWFTGSCTDLLRIGYDSGHLLLETMDRRS